MILSAQQLAYFHQFGFLCARQLFTPTETAVITEGFERTMAECGPAKPSLQRRSCVLGPI